MDRPAKRDIYLSLFLFTADLRPKDEAYTQVLIDHIRTLRAMGYDGFDLPIAAQQTADHKAEIESYRRFKEALDAAGFEAVGFTTNVGTTRTFDPTSFYKEQREGALAYLKSRVDITSILGGNTVMAGPILFPYGVFPTLDSGAPLWSDALQDWLRPRYELARPVIEELADYAEKKAIKLAIEPVDHWETPAPNMVSDVLGFLRGVRSPQAGLTIDSAHVVLGSKGPAAFKDSLRATVEEGRLHYIHISAPDRGALKDSWIPWKTFLGPVLPVYDGPFLIEVFNAVAPFLDGLRLTRRKFWIPGEDRPVPGQPSAYDVARDGLETLLQQFALPEGHLVQSA
ncbi:sugar phosphate isomerase/epimerase family protein (plasmid) [Rhizobium sp. T1470]|uniref:sugar phosphate isomerase/epimerase family protein n=1 Tax=unclassified Rhizobium TaxID=2613769 RepID=UPI001AAEFCDA|nr:sugar phosphate isomerase/epimerase family protein [Rhizobium sp. T1473]MCA0807407.1 sugar phosphate isomerase/epimerase [Rhizobium sp. T1473]